MPPNLTDLKDRSSQVVVFVAVKGWLVELADVGRDLGPLLDL